MSLQTVLLQTIVLANLVEVGCRDPTKDCLRKISVDKIIHNQRNFPLLQAEHPLHYDLLPMSPVVDDHLVPGNILERLANGHFNRSVPIILGYLQ